MNEGSGNDILDAVVYLQGDGFFVFVGSFEGLQLAAEKLWVEEMFCPRTDSLLQQGSVTGKVEVNYGAWEIAEINPVLALEGGTGEDTDAWELPHGGPQGDHPVHAFIIIEWCAGTHFGFVLGRVKVVALEKRAIQLFGQGFADYSFATTRNTHDDNNG